MSDLTKDRRQALLDQARRAAEAEVQRLPSALFGKIVFLQAVTVIVTCLLVWGLIGLGRDPLFVFLPGISLVVVSWGFRGRWTQSLQQLLRSVRKLLSDRLGDSGESIPTRWADLALALDQVRSELRTKTETLAREREELATVMAALTEAIVAFGRDGRPLFFNSRYALLFQNRDLQSLSQVSENVVEAFRETLNSGEPAQAQLDLTDPASNSERHLAVSVAPLRRAEGGEVYGVVGIFHDVTEHKRAEQIRIDFVANVSHELRTPLTSIKGYADTLVVDAQAGKLDSRGAIPFLEVIQRNVSRLMDLIGDLLNLSSMDSGVVVLQKVGVDTVELTQRVLKQTEHQRAAKGHWIETACEARVVDADPGRVEQVLVNLVANAIQYVPHGGKIWIRWEPGPKGTLLRVADNGPGIPPEHQARLFERFYRIDKARSREMGGTGLGLAIVKHIVQAHGGNVYITSEPGKGAEFVCFFPH